MSAYILSWDHIGVLVNLGYQLDIPGITVGNSYQSLALDDEHDRTYVAAELAAANRTSVAHRYQEPVNPAGDTPTFRLPPSRLDTFADYAQALQWVRCYDYQSCEDPAWPTTFAHHYTQRLTAELTTRIIGCFNTSWDYDGPALTSAMAPGTAPEC